MASDVEVLGRLLSERHSCRAFLPQPVERKMIESVLALAQKTASWCNTQPWQIHLISGSTLETIRAAMIEGSEAGIPVNSDLPWPKEYKGIYLERRREAGFALHNAVGVPRGDLAARDAQTRENFRMFGAPHVALITTDETLGVYGAVDCGGYVANFLLAVQAHGLGAIAQAALARFSPLFRERLGLPQDRLVVCGISFGYPDRTAKANSFRTTRASLDQVVTWVD
ncbi:MAG: nitroreductase [Alphaproteobacteria bacterium]|nr:nitroreductase [Alphaproteobacteria bacterium]